MRRFKKALKSFDIILYPLVSYSTGMSKSSYLRCQILWNSMKTESDHFNFRLKFSWNLWNFVSRRIKKLCDFWTCPRKIEIKVQPIDLLSWIKFRGPELNQGSCLENFSFSSLISRSEPRDHKVSLKPHSGATRKDPDPKRIPRASFDVLDLCAKFQDHTLTGSTSNRGTTRPPRDQICACLL